MSKPDQHILECFHAADSMANDEYPYVFGGGHPGFGPSENGDNKNGVKGYDCSGWVSAILHAGEILEHPTEALGTNELEEWGFPGKGEFMTLFVINSPDLEHCFLEFDLPEYPTKRISMAAHSGTICGWYGMPGKWTEGYTPRRRKAFT